MLHSTHPQFASRPFWRFRVHIGTTLHCRSSRFATQLTLASSAAPTSVPATTLTQSPRSDASAPTDSFSQFLFANNDLLANVSPSHLGADLALTSLVAPTQSPAPGTPTINNFDTTHDWENLRYLDQLDSTPPLAKHSMEVLLRVLKTWPKMLAKEFQPPPLLHSSQMYQILTSQSQNQRIQQADSASPVNPVPQPLANCFTIAKMWAGQCEGASGIVTETVTKEMQSLFEKVCPYPLWCTEEAPVASATYCVSHC